MKKVNLKLILGFLKVPKAENLDDSDGMQIILKI